MITDDSYSTTIAIIPLHQYERWHTTVHGDQMVSTHEVQYLDYALCRQGLPRWAHITPFAITCDVQSMCAVCVETVVSVQLSYFNLIVREQ